MPVKRASALSRITFTSTAARTRVKLRYLTSTIVLHSSATPISIFGGWATSELTLSQTVRTAGQHLFPTSTFTTIPLDVIIEAGTDDPDALAALFEQYGITQQVTLSRAVTNIDIKHNIFLTQKAARGHFVSASSHIHLSGYVKKAKSGVCDQFLLITQSAVGVNTKGAGNELELTQVAVGAHIVSHSLTSTLSLTSSSVSVWSGANPSCPVPPTHRDTVQLYCNSSTLIKALTLELRNPDFGDSEQYEPMRINRRSRGGTLHIYRDSNWPVSRRLVYTFSQLSESDKKDLLEFLEKTVGLEIQLTDFESRVWNGVITTPSADFEQHSMELNRVTLQFEGALA